MVLQAGWKTGTPPQYRLALLVAAATLCSYNFHYLLASIQRSSSGNLVLKGRPAAWMLMVTGGAFALWQAPAAGVPLHLLLLAALLTLLYSLPLLPLRWLEFTRRLGAVKTFWLAFTWTYVTGYLPLVAAGVDIQGVIPWFLLFRFSFMLILCILFDNRDVEVDQLKGFSSLATHFSEKTVRRLMAILIITMLLSAWQMLDQGAPPRMIIPLSAGIIINGMIYFLSRQKQGYFFYYFVVDGTMVITALITWGCLQL